MRVSNPAGSADSDTATVTVLSAPTIITQPQSTTSFAGFTTLLSVTASGSSLSYQWYQGSSGDTSLPVGTDSDSFTTPALTTSTSYWVRVSNPAGSVDSDTATVTIEGAPVITTQPQSQTIISGAAATLSVTASGGSLSYQWYQGASGDTSTPVGTDSNMLLTPALTSDTSYWVRVSNPAGSTDSDTATLSILTAPVITTQPQSQTIPSGATATLSVVASGGGLSYQWYQGNSGDTSMPIGGATSDTYTTPALITTTSYWVRVSNPAGSADSQTAIITIGSGTIAPVITLQPQDQTIPSGTTVTMQVVASGDSLSYQWYLGTSGDTSMPIGGATSDAFTTPALTTDTNYWVQVSNSAGSVNSRTAIITVTAAAPTPSWTFVAVHHKGCASGSTYLDTQIAGMIVGHSYYMDATVSDASGNYYMSQHAFVTLAVSGGILYQYLQDINELSLSPKLPFPLPKDVPLTVTLTLLDGDGTTQLSQSVINYTCNTGAVS